MDTPFDKLTNIHTAFPTLVITQHLALVEYLCELDLVPVDVSVTAHATPEDVAGKHIIGVLPLWLASLATSVIEVPLHLPVTLRGVELTLGQIRKYARSPRRYTVTLREVLLPQALRK